MNRAQRLRLLLSVCAKGDRRDAGGKRSAAARAVGVAAKVILWLLACGWGLAMATEAATWGKAAIFGFMPYILSFDFALRLALQQRPASATPFLLLPVGKGEIGNCCLASSLATGYNLYWASMLLAYSAALPASANCGWTEAFGVFAVCLVVMLANNLWYLLTVGLAASRPAWWWLPVALYTIPLATSFCGVSGEGVAAMFLWCCRHGLTPAAIVAYIAAAALLWCADAALTISLAHSDSRKVSKAASHGSRAATIPNGSSGRYFVWLEAKSTMRNPAVKRNVAQSTALTALLSIALAASPNEGVGAFGNMMWCLYCFLLLPISTISRIMEVEGNYIGLLLTRKDCLGELLKAKYRCLCLTIALPAAMLLPAVATGKLTWGELLAGLLTASGTAAFMLFQLAAHNRQAMPLDDRGGRKTAANATRKLATVAAVIALPCATLGLVGATAGHGAAIATLAATGAALTTTHRLWLSNIHKRMLRTKYEMAEGFNASRK